MAELPKGYTFSLGLDEESKKEFEEIEFRLKKMRDMVDYIVKTIHRIKVDLEEVMNESEN